MRISTEERDFSPENITGESPKSLSPEIQTLNPLKSLQKISIFRNILNMPYNQLDFVLQICIVKFPLTNHRNV